MKLTNSLIVLVGLVVASPVLATDGGGLTPFQFEFTAQGGAIPAVDGFPANNEGISVFPLTMSNPRITEILSLELQLNGLTHAEPADLDIYLIDPFGETLEVMTDRGDAVGVINFDLIFNDLGADGIPPELDGIPLLDGAHYMPEGSGGFGIYRKQSGGTDAWILLIIDDSAGDSGFLDSWTLRGTGVPEPMTLSLFLIGGAAMLVRRRKSA